MISASAQSWVRLNGLPFILYNSVEIFLFIVLYIIALGLTQPHIHWTLVALYAEVETAKLRN